MGLAKDNSNVSECWRGGNSTYTGGEFLYNHNWVEFWDSETKRWVFLNVPPATRQPNTGWMCSKFSYETGCDFDPSKSGKGGCDAAFRTGRAGAASADHEIFSITWTLPGETAPGLDDGGSIVDAKGLTLSNGMSASPLVWSPSLSAPSGEPLKDVGLRMVNRTDTYRCHEPAS